MTQLVIKNTTMERLERITGKKILRGGDKMINEALDILEGKKDGQ